MSRKDKEIKIQINDLVSTITKCSAIQFKYIMSRVNIKDEDKKKLEEEVINLLTSQIATEIAKLKKGDK